VRSPKLNLRLFSGARIRRQLDFPGLIDALRAGHLHEPPKMERTLMVQPTPRGNEKSYVAWHAWSDDFLCVKMVTIYTANPRKTPPLPAVQSVVTLFDGEDGEPTALIDGTELTYWKTAADTCLGGEYLAREDAKTLLVIGAGGLAPYHIKAYRSIRPALETVLIWNRDKAKARSVAADTFIDGPAKVVDDLEAAVSKADIVCCLTPVIVPILKGKWLKPGTHVALVGGYTPQMREADDEVMRRSRIFVDTRWFTIEHCGDLVAPINAGAMAVDDIAADLFELCRGVHPGRESEEEITVFKNAGGAHLDLFASRYLLQCLGDEE
jgi:ornithine cyclodeaminase